MTSKTGLYPRPPEVLNHSIGVDSENVDSIIDNLVLSSQRIRELPSIVSIERLRVSCGYYAYVDQNYKKLLGAINEYNSIKQIQHFQLPVSGEDEIAIIFYCIIYNQNSEIKKETLRGILGDQYHPTLDFICDTYSN